MFPGVWRANTQIQINKYTNTQIQLWFKMQGHFVSGGTTLSEYPHGGITLLELTWRAHWTKLAILNQHARGGITQSNKITQPFNKK